MFTVDNLWGDYRPVAPVDRPGRTFGVVLLSGVSLRTSDAIVELVMMHYRNRWAPIVTLGWDGTVPQGLVTFGPDGLHADRPEEALLVPTPVPSRIMDLLVQGRQVLLGYLARGFNIPYLGPMA